MAEVHQTPRFAVLGVGGVGGYLGGMLADSGLDVTFVSRPETAQLLRTSGLVLKTVDREIVLPKVQAVGSPSELRDVDVVLLTTKSYDLDDAVRGLPEQIKRESMLVTFQNGIDNDQRVKALLPEAEVHPGIAYIVSARKGPGLIEQSAGPRKFLIGERGEVENPRISDIALVMRDAGLDVTATPDVEKELWTKFIWILAFAGVTGTCRSPIGRIVNDSNGFQMFTRCVDEAIHVARALNVKIGESERATVLGKAEGYKTKGTGAKASLAIDLDEGRRTEVEALHGALVRIAATVNVPVPTIEAMYTTIKLAEAAQRKIG